MSFSPHLIDVPHAECRVRRQTLKRMLIPEPKQVTMHSLAVEPVPPLLTPLGGKPILDDLTPDLLEPVRMMIPGKLNEKATNEVPDSRMCCWTMR